MTMHPVRMHQLGPFGYLAWGLTRCAVPLAIMAAWCFGVAILRGPLFTWERAHHEG